MKHVFFGNLKCSLCDYFLSKFTLRIIMHSKLFAVSTVEPCAFLRKIHWMARAMWVVIVDSCEHYCWSLKSNAALERQEYLSQVIHFQIVQWAALDQKVVCFCSKCGQSSEMNSWYSNIMLHSAGESCWSDFTRAGGLFSCGKIQHNIDFRRGPGGNGKKQTKYRRKRFDCTA